MLSKSDKTAVLKCAKSCNVSAIYLFGCSLDKNPAARDIDLGVKGINPKLFFKFHGELMRALQRR
jgi:hypothetical protein